MPDIRLREVVAADIEVFFQHEQDPEAVRRARFPARGRAAFFAHWTENILGKPNVLARTVTVDGATAGNIASWWHGERRFLGYWLGREHWGHGVGTASLGLFLRTETVRPLYADPSADNTASVRLLQRHGFRRIDTDWDGDDEFAVLVRWV